MKLAIFASLVACTAAFSQVRMIAVEETKRLEYRRETVRSVRRIAGNADLSQFFFGLTMDYALI